MKTFNSFLPYVISYVKLFENIAKTRVPIVVPSSLELLLTWIYVCKDTYDKDMTKLIYTRVHIQNTLLSIKVPLKMACKPSDWLRAIFRDTFVNKRRLRICIKMYIECKE